jgi:glutamate-ammonia-ligase adenylyltransferase
LGPADERELAAAYEFLRDVEHRLQMENNRQTHTIPAEHAAQARLARLMGFAGSREFDRARAGHCRNVRRVFEKVLKAEVPESLMTLPFPRHFDGAETEWKRLLVEHSFKDPDRAFRVLREFVEGPGYVHVSSRTKELALQLLPKLFDLCPRAAAPNAEVSTRRKGAKGAPAQKPLERSASPLIEPNPKPPLSDPDRVVTRLDSFIVTYGARATLFELWNSTPTIFELLVLLFDRSEFLAELAIRVPDLVDELVMSGRLRQRKSAAETLEDLRHGLDDPDQSLWLRRYHQAELMRIGLRDILGLADFEQYLVELSALAEACLQYAVESVSRSRKLRSLPLAIIGLGKLGGAEIDYGSDLDLLFVADSKVKNLSALAPVANDIMELLSRRTEQGLVFHTDARLRPDGEKGLLVNTVAACEDYYRRRAQLWEVQALSRARAVAGNAALGTAFCQMAMRLANFRQPQPKLTAFAPDWKARIDRMRQRIEKERTPAGKDALAIKTGSGGLMDAEFIAQALCLAQGWHEPNTLRALERGRQQRVLVQADSLIESYRRLRRVEGILRRWSYEGETVLPDDPAPYYRVAIRCGFPNADAFRDAIRAWRQEIRSAYLAIFSR